MVLIIDQNLSKFLMIGSMSELPFIIASKSVPSPHSKAKRSKTFTDHLNTV